jgi:hypothetical protein
LIWRKLVSTIELSSWLNQTATRARQLRVACKSADGEHVSRGMEVSVTAAFSLTRRRRVGRVE